MSDYTIRNLRDVNDAAAGREIEEVQEARFAPVVRAFEASGEGLEVLMFGPHHSGDGEIIQDDVWEGA